jgi:serine/threonine protein kinase
MSLVAGTRLGPYEIHSAIGAGGMGEVYKARDTRLDRTVAVEVLPAAISGDPDRRARFEREARTIGGLNHPHICTLHDVGEGVLPNPESRTPNPEPVHYLVMEHLAGETLAERLQKGRLPPDQALTVATESADALAAAHRQGIVHRDLKPGTVMLTKAGAKLLDFGLAGARMGGSRRPRRRPDRRRCGVGAPTSRSNLSGSCSLVARCPAGR